MQGDISKKNWALIWCSASRASSAGTWKLLFSTFVYNKVAPDPSIISWMVGSARCHDFCTFLIGTGATGSQAQTVRQHRLYLLGRIHHRLRRGRIFAEITDHAGRHVCGARGRGHELLRLVRLRRGVLHLDDGHLKRAQPRPLGARWRSAGHRDDIRLRRLRLIIDALGFFDFFILMVGLVIVIGSFRSLP